MELVKELVTDNNNAKEILTAEITEDYGSTAERLKATIDTVTAAYAVIPQYPSNEKNGKIVWYYIQRNESNEYLTVERSTKRYINYLMHTETTKENSDDYMLWAFLPTGSENEYYIFNAGSGCALFGKSYLEAMGGGEAKPYTLSLDTARQSFTISDDNSYIYGSGTYPKLNTKANYYRLEKAFESDIAILASTDGESYGRKAYGKPMTEESNVYVCGTANATFVDLRDNNDATLIIEKCRQQLGASNTVYYTSLDAESAAAAGSNVVDKNGICQEMNINNESAYYIPESFTASEVTYTDKNSAGDNIIPIMLPFVPTNRIVTSSPSCFSKTDVANILTLAYTKFEKNTPMFAIADGKSINATATNVTIEASVKEDRTTDYLLMSYVGTSYKISTYLYNNGKYTKSVQAGTLAPFEINIKALPGSTNSVSNIELYYDESTGIDNIEKEDTENAIYDLTGRKIEKIIAPGIYIVNKKKVVIREVL